MKDKYQVTEICERQVSSKTHSKSAAAFDYVDKTFLVLSAASGGLSISSFGTIIGGLIEITSTILGWIFYLDGIEYFI